MRNIFQMNRRGVLKGLGGFLSISRNEVQSLSIPEILNSNWRRLNLLYLYSQRPCPQRRQIVISVHFNDTGLECQESMSKTIVRYLRLGTVVAAEMGVIRYITAAFRTPFDSVNTKSLTPLRINGKGAVKKLVNFRRFVDFRWGHWVRRHIRGGKEHKSPPFQSDQDIFLKREILSKATFNFFRPLTLSRLKFRFLSHLSSTFGSRPDKFIDAGLNLLIGFASRNGEDLFLEFVPLENHLLSAIQFNLLSSNDLIVPLPLADLCHS